MKIADSRNFVSVLSEEKPPMVFFHYKAEAAQAKKIALTLNTIAKDLTNLPLYEYIIDQSEENQVLADYLDLNATPILLFFKEGQFHRYKDKNFTKKSILQFIGNNRLYKKVEETNEESTDKDKEIL